MAAQVAAEPEGIAMTTLLTPSDVLARDCAHHWLLSAQERGNRATTIDMTHEHGAGWSVGGRVQAHVDGAEYFARLHETLSALGRDDCVYLTGWRMNTAVRLAGSGSELGPLLARLARRGVAIRGLLWRSYSFGFNEATNRAASTLVNQAGGQIVADQRVRRFGSHHQKFLVVHTPGDPSRDAAFVGGIDLSEGRFDGGRHLGDEHPLRLNPQYGPRPPWHDLQLEVSGPPVADIELTFRERWEDRTPRDHRNPMRAAFRRLSREPRHLDLLPRRPAPAPAGPHLVQVLRTYPSRRRAIPFAPEGERSIARAYVKALRRARSLVYIEDQFLWSSLVTEPLCRALRDSPELRMIVVLPRHPDHDRRFSGWAARAARWAAIRDLVVAGGPRVAVYDLENELGTPIYVHAKTMIVDDVWAIAGSANLNRRSWTHDSEIACAVLDQSRDPREPSDPAGLGDGARIFARTLRLRLWREHLGTADIPEDDLLDPIRGFETMRSVASGLQAWYDGGLQGPRPPGRIRPHRVEPSRIFQARWIPPLCRLLIDPDGRPLRLQLGNSL
jgi:phosphatidylserine/phosphatidylglycerophosphate/cardiolipin synthase-like enzyme